MQAEKDAEFVGAALDAGLRAARFSLPPSSEEFAASIEPKNVPAVFRGVLKGSAALSRWDPLYGGLDYLLEKVGPDVAVEAMMSNTGHVFYGDLRSHERVSIPFSTFMQSCKSHLGHLNAASDSSKDKGTGKESTCSDKMCPASSENSEQLYLAQASSQPFNKVTNSDTSDKKGAALQSLKPCTLQALYELMSLVHNSVEAVDQNDRAESASQDTSVCQSNERKKTAADDSSLLEKDPVAKIILPVEPLELRSMLLAMVHTFPRTLEGLVLNILGPTGAEILTRKFDEMDQGSTPEEQAEFYKIFYSAFGDQYAAMDALLNRKELFSFQVFQSVLDQYLRVCVERPS
ncbi:hypothetical protein ACQ4PT_027450 [Festuca glaucescens]